MRPRFQADADFNYKVVMGLRRREPSVDFLGAREGCVIGVPDLDVLSMAAKSGRILVSHDRKTMPGHFARFCETQSSPGLIYRKAGPRYWRCDRGPVIDLGRDGRRGMDGTSGFRACLTEVSASGGILPGAIRGRRDRRRGDPVGTESKMIKNEKQYRITKAQVRRFQDALAELAGQQRPSKITPRLWRVQREAAQSQMQELRKQVEAYERLEAREGIKRGLRDVEAGRVTPLRPFEKEFRARRGIASRPR